MTIYNNALMTTFYFGNKAAEEERCVVSINDRQILVACYGETVEYKGSSFADGHYELEGSGFKARASLHMTRDKSTLEGSWYEEGNRGMWSIDLEV